MKLLVRRSVAAISVLICAGCGRVSGPSATDPLPVDQMRVTFQKSFQTADSATRDEVNKFVDDAEKHQIPAAFAEINDLMTAPNLNKDQNITIVRAANTIGQQLSDAAQNGDQQAVDTLHAVTHKH